MLPIAPKGDFELFWTISGKKKWTGADAQDQNDVLDNYRYQHSASQLQSKSVILPIWKNSSIIQIS